MLPPLISSNQVSATISQDLAPNQRLEEEETAELRRGLNELTVKQEISVNAPFEEVETLKAEHERTLSKTQELRISERTISERTSKVESLERVIQSNASELETVRADRDSQVRPRDET